MRFYVACNASNETKLHKCIRIQNFHLGRYIFGYTVRATLPRRYKTKFLTVHPMIYLPKWKFWIQLSPKCHDISVLITQARSECSGKHTRPYSLALDFFAHMYKIWKQIIRFHHECEGEIEISVTRITVGIMRLAKWWQTVIGRNRFFYPSSHK